MKFKYFIISLLSFTLLSCSSEDSPETLRTKARELEIRAKAIEIEQIRKKNHRESVHGIMERKSTVEIPQDVAKEEIVYIDGHRYKMWFKYSYYTAFLSMVHDPKCEMEDIRKIIREEMK